MTRNRQIALRKMMGKGLKVDADPMAGSSGFTLIESLVAMIVISITLVAIVPPIFWATGTRVQNRRAEQALAIAQGEIDRVRGVLERSDVPLAANLPPQVTKAEFASYRGPNPKSSWANKMRSTLPKFNTAETSTDGIQFPENADTYIPVDTDGDGKADFLVQVFRDPGTCMVVNPCVFPDTPRIFAMKVRVYSAIAIGSDLTNLETQKAALIGTTGTGQSKNRPLAVLSSQVARSVSSGALEQRREYKPGQ